MSLSERAGQLDALADGQEAQGVLGALQQASAHCEEVGSQAAGIIGDLPAGNEANGVWQQVKSQIDDTVGMAAMAIQRLHDIAQNVRSAGS
jgi:hypothetical protein